MCETKRISCRILIAAASFGVIMASDAVAGKRIILGDSLIVDAPMLPDEGRQLEDAIMARSLGGVQSAIASRVDVNMRGADGITPLILAVSREDVETIAALLKAGAEPNAKTDGGTPVIWFAATRGNSGPLKLLLDAGADPNLIDEPRHESPLLGALRSHSIENVKLLVMAHADLNYQNLTGVTPSMAAVTFGEFDIACYLVEAGASTALKNKYGKSLIDVAQNRKVGNQEAIRQARDRLLYLLHFSSRESTSGGAK